MRKLSLKCLGAALAGLVILSPSLWAQQPAKLIVKNARLFTMAEGKKDVFTGYLVVGEDGRLTAVAAGDPPAGLKA